MFYVNSIFIYCSRFFHMLWFFCVSGFFKVFCWPSINSIIDDVAECLLFPLGTDVFSYFAHVLILKKRRPFGNSCLLFYTHAACSFKTNVTHKVQ